MNPLLHHFVEFVKPKIRRFGFDIICYADWSSIFKDIDLLVDVGAFTGESYDYFRRMGYRGKILSFEPDPVSFSKLLQHPGYSWEKQQLALSSEPGKKMFHSGLGQRNSLHVPLDVASPSVVPIECTRLDTVSAVQGRNIFLKIDAEGHDLEVFKGASGLLDKIRYVLLEVAPAPRYEGEPEFAEVIAEMARHKFKVDMVDRNYFCPETRKSLAMDVLFKRM